MWDIPEIDKVKGICYFLAKQKTDPAWADKSPMEQLGDIAVYMSNKPKERKFVSQYGAVRLSKEEARDVIAGQSKPGNLFIYMVIYEERGGKRIGYVFYRGFGNQ
eukprot:5251165-Heterocapsa_arctica.AAC.1